MAMEKLNIAILGGTHGNELVGIEVARTLISNPPKSHFNHFKAIIANPKACEQKLRFIDFDLNRSFGPETKTHGYEKNRSYELRKEIEGKYDFLVDLHTTTTNMGLTLIVNHDDELSWKAAYYLKTHFSDLKIIKSLKTVPNSPYTANMAKSGLTIEVGPVSNNIINANLVLNVRKMVDLLLDFKFEAHSPLPKMDYFQTIGEITFPNPSDLLWYVHPERDRHDFKLVKKGDPLFINLKGDVINYQNDEPFYPFFINEAAYQYQNIAMSKAKLIQAAK